MERCRKRLLTDGQGNQLPRLSRRTRCHDNVLLTADRIGHRHSRLALTQVDLCHDLPRALVMGFE